uniref:Uncharacterized protein n=1 Tax=Rhizophora mucronata TaxID=61149 RepID=A0A2P2QJK4_RHIMU
MAVQYQSPANTSVRLHKYDATSGPPYLGYWQRWQASRFLKFWCWHAAHSQSPPVQLIF